MSYLFGIAFLFLLYNAFKLMLQGYKAFDQSYGKVMQTYKPKKVHPEMTDVENGDELMVASFSQIPPVKDPLHESLQSRIEELIEEEDDDEDDDEGDGDIIVRV